MFYLEKYPRTFLKKEGRVLKSCICTGLCIQCVEGKKSAYIYIKMFIMLPPQERFIANDFYFLFKHYSIISKLSTQVIISIF